MAAGKITQVTGPEVAKAQKVEQKVEIADDGFVQQPVAKSKNEKGPFLRGISDVALIRRVTQQDFAALGIEQGTLEFSWGNDFKIPLSQVSEEAAEWLIANEYGFSIVDE